MSQKIGQSKKVEFCYVCEHAVKQTIMLKKAKRILATSLNYYGEGLDKERKKCVVEFYERDDVSHMCPGKKDCVSIRNKDGSKEKVQKGLRLATISEIYANFKAEFPSLKIGFSTFALLRSKWYMSVDVAGSHNVCMHLPSKCKTFLNTVNISLNYKGVLKLCVFSTENSDCMLHHCDLCPEQTVACNILKEQLLLNYIFGDLVKYKQWVSTDRSNLEEHVGDLDYFLDKLTSMFFELTKHHFIAKKQSEFLRVKKASLKFDEAVLILNFAENYSFVCVRFLYII